MSSTGRVLMAVLIVGAAGGWYAWREHGVHQGTRKKPVAAAPAPVTVATVGLANFPLVISGLGSVQPFNTVTVRSRVDGQIMKMDVKEGQIVKQGDLLLQIDPRPYQAALAQATAKEQQDEANLANAQVTFQRDAQLIKQNYASRQQYDNDAANVRQLTALVAADKASVFNAQTQLGYTTIRAPIGGRTSLRSIDVGNIVQAASPTGIMTIDQVQPIAVAFSAPEGDLPEIYEAQQKGAPVVTALTADGSRILGKGQLSVINNAVDTATGTIQLKAEFSNDDNALWPGLSVVTQMSLGSLQNVVVVPDAAVQHGPEGLYAYVVDADDKAQVRPITVERRSDTQSVISKGLNPGDRVVVAGQYRLEPGAPVAIRATPATDLAQEQ